MYSREEGAAVFGVALMLALALPLVAVLVQSLVRRRLSSWHRMSGGRGVRLLPPVIFRGYRELPDVPWQPALPGTFPAATFHRDRARTKPRRSAVHLGRFSVGG